MTTPNLSPSVSRQRHISVGATGFEEYIDVLGAGNANETVDTIGHPLAPLEWIEWAGNGAVLVEGTDYAISDKTITFLTAHPTGVRALRVVYRIAPSAGGTSETVAIASPLRNQRLDMVEVFTTGECLADQPGDGTARTFTFASPVVQVWILCQGGNGRADPFSGTPAVATGIPCLDGVPMPITISTTIIKVFALSGVTISVWGFRP